jgi:hypothetical protein
MSDEEKTVEFRKELESLLNRYCWENKTNIPDFLLAQTVLAFLINIEMMMKATMEWHNWPSLSEKLRLNIEASK